jgi:hypothetical protein
MEIKLAPLLRDWRSHEVLHCPILQQHQTVVRLTQRLQETLQPRRLVRGERELAVGRSPD